MTSFATIISLGEKYADISVEKIPKEESENGKKETFTQSILLKALEFSVGRKLNIGDRLIVEHQDEFINKVLKS